MRTVVNRALCMGHALCASLAPELFTVDDEGCSNIGQPEVLVGLEDVARSGAMNCPERASRSSNK
jgi:ferredoxin